MMVVVVVVVVQKEEEGWLGFSYMWKWSGV